MVAPSEVPCVLSETEKADKHRYASFRFTVGCASRHHTASYAVDIVRWLRACHAQYTNADSEIQECKWLQPILQDLFCGKDIVIPPVTAKYPLTNGTSMQRSICRFCSHTITDLYGDWFHYSDAAGSRTNCAVCGCARAVPKRKSGRKAQWTDERSRPPGEEAVSGFGAERRPACVQARDKLSCEGIHEVRPQGADRQHGTR